MSPNESIIVEDIIAYYRDFIRLGSDSELFSRSDNSALVSFRAVFARQVQTFYPALRPLPHFAWPGVICQPFAFGEGRVDWSGAEDLKARLSDLLKRSRGDTLDFYRVARIYDDRYVFLIKPDRLRYWVRSIALRDADETLADLRAQGY